MSQSRAQTIHQGKDSFKSTSTKTGVWVIILGVKGHVSIPRLKPYIKEKIVSRALSREPSVADHTLRPAIGSQEELHGNSIKSKPHSVKPININL